MGASCGPVEVRGRPKSWCSSSGGGGGGKGGDWEPGRAKFKLKWFLWKNKWLIY